MIPAKRSSVYGSMPSSIMSVVPKKQLRHSWIKCDPLPDDVLNERQKQNCVITSYVHLQSLEDARKPSGSVRRRANFFEQKPLRRAHSTNAQRLSNNINYELIKYRFKPNYPDYPNKAPHRVRKTLHDFPQWNQFPHDNYANEMDTIIIKKDNNSRRNTLNITADIHTIGENMNCPEQFFQNASIQLQKGPPISVTRSSFNCNQVTLGCAAPAKPSRLIARCARPETVEGDYSTAPNNGIDLKENMGVPNEDANVPRIVGASMKYVNGFPEEYLDKLEESSVDPSPEERQCMDSGQWQYRKEGRNALQQDKNTCEKEVNRCTHGKGQIISINGEKYSFIQPQITTNGGYDLEGSDPAGSMKICPKGNKLQRQRKPPAPPPRSQIPRAKRPLPDVHSKLSDLQQELRRAGVYFRKPGEPTNEEALKVIESSFQGLCNDSSSESVSAASTAIENEDTGRKLLSVRSGRQLSAEVPIITVNKPCDNKDVNCRVSIPINNSSIPSSPNNKTIIQLNGSPVSRPEAMERLNLIEEVYISSKTKAVTPKSSVQIKAYYPGIDFNSNRTHPDSDSGHESGATSPCNTSSPPPSPAGPKSTISIGKRMPASKNKIINDQSEKDPANRLDNDAGTCDEDNKSSHFVVVAVDFGTTYSGYAFSFTQQPEDIHMMKRWEGGDPGILNQKTPTIVLLTPDEKFHSMGYTARDTFHDLDPKEALDWLYFDKFKMDLHTNQVLTRQTTLESSNGKKISALTIFTFALRYFRDHALKDLTEQTGMHVEEGDIRWVVTVPAIWSYPAKQFMRLAAIQAGMGSSLREDQLIIALEPEAAAIYCRRLKRNQLLPDIPPEMRDPIPKNKYSSLNSRSSRLFTEFESSSVTPNLDRGTVYMVVDCGGGTVDITVHQMTNHRSGHLKEIHKATGGPYGSIGVDLEFQKMLNTIFGESFMAYFKKQRPVAYLDMMVAFESRKRNASPYKTSPLNVALPFSLIDLYKKTKGKEVDAAIRKHADLGVKWSSQGMLRIEQDTMRKLFLPTMEKIRETIESALSAPEISGIEYMFLVGGFCESELLQKYIRDSFSHRVSVVIPQGMSLAILRGAVQFGLDPSVVTVRRSRHTYGVGVLNKFQEGVHPPEKRVVSAGAAWCADILDKFVEIDQSVAIGDVITRSYTPALTGQKEVILHLYATDRDDAKFITDINVRRVGTLRLQLNETGMVSYENDPSTETDIPPSAKNTQSTLREITVHFRFGGTEVRTSAIDHQTGQCVRASIEFLAL